MPHRDNTRVVDDEIDSGDGQRNVEAQIRDWAALNELVELVEAVRPLLETIIEKQHRTRWAAHYVAMEDLDGPFRAAFAGVIRANRTLVSLDPPEDGPTRRAKAHDRDVERDPYIRRDVAALGGDPSL